MNFVNLLAPFLEGANMHKEQVPVLLVDDDEDDYIIIRDLISKIDGAHFSLEWVTTFEAALDAVKHQKHAVYLVDYCLGVHDGLELISEVNDGGQHVPIIMITGQEDRDVDMAAMRNGAADYLVKGQISAQNLERSIRYALERSRLINTLNELAIRDELTGLYNRREMNRILWEDINRHRRNGRPISIIMLDIDHFKDVNDAYGHLVGDKVLQWIARILQEAVRSIDRVVRYGGEEFAVVLPETPVTEALQVAERLRQIIVANPFLLRQDEGSWPPQIPITVSIGVAQLPGDADSGDTLIAAADRALYIAKHQGRNRTVQFRGGCLHE